MSLAIFFNKPFGVPCQFSGAPGRPTLREFLPQRDVYAAGRLDADSEGLLILTADGALQYDISHPQSRLSKTYCVQVEGVPDEDALRRLREGIALREFTTKPAAAERIDEPAWLWPRTPPVRFRRVLPTTWLQIVLSEGKNRQVRRMTAAVGFPTLRLIRYAIGEWTLDGLAPGAWREIEIERDPVVATIRGARGRPRVKWRS